MNTANTDTTNAAWVFVSHSHRDLNKVREIRDELERLGHNPLLFYLKCLDDDAAVLPDLLKREIAARQWFILCDSPSARASKWVQEEIAIIKALEGKVFEVIDLEKPLAGEIDKVLSLSKRATVYISYTHLDSRTANRIGTYLSHAGYRVWLDKTTPSATNYMDEIRRQIDNASATGFLVLILSEDYFNSAFIREKELPYIVGEDFQRKRNIRCVLASHVSTLTRESESCVGLRQFPTYAIIDNDFEVAMAALVQSMKTETMD